MAPTRIRIVLKDVVTDTDFTRLCSAQKWYFYDQEPRQEGRPFDSTIWRTSGGATAIEFIEDFMVHLRYILIHGREVEGVAKTVRAGLATVDDTEVRHMMRTAQDRDDKIAAIAHLAIAAPAAFDAEYYRLLHKGLTDSDPAMRCGAILAVGYMEWPELRASVARLKTADPDEKVRQAAQRMLESLDHTAQQPRYR